MYHALASTSPRVRRVNSPARRKRGRAVTACLVEPLEARRMLNAQMLNVRDPWLRPFSSDSIWNTAIGSSAVHVNSLSNGIGLLDGDDTYIYAGNPSDPVRPVNLVAGFFPPRVPSFPTPSFRSIEIPDSYTVADATLVPYSTPNNPAAFLRADGRTLVNLEPLTRPTPGGGVFAYNNEDTFLFGDGNDGHGSHFGSNLSALGGLIRVGELTGPDPISHVLQIELPTYLLYKNLFSSANRNETYRWPATTSDSNYSEYGTDNTSVPGLRMGSLLALAPSATISSLGIRTPPGRKLFKALQDYGALIVDTSGGNGFRPNGADYINFGIEAGVKSEFRATFGYDFSVSAPGNSDWYFDVNALYTNLKLVENNSPVAVGGGGSPRVATQPSLAYGNRRAINFTTQIEAEDYNPGGPGVGYSDSTPDQLGRVPHPYRRDGATSYRNDSVDIRPVTRDTGRGFQVTSTVSAEWLNYDVAVTAGTYDISFRIAAGPRGGKLHLENQFGADLTGPITASCTCGQDTFSTFTRFNVPLAGGNQTYRLVIDTGGIDINWFRFTPSLIQGNANHFINGSFESEARGSTAVPGGWQRGGNASSAIVTSNFAGGTRAARVTVSDFSAASTFQGRYNVLNQNLSGKLEVGRSYRLSGSISAVSAGFGAGGAFYYNGNAHYFGSGNLRFDFTYTGGNGGYLALQLDLLKFSGPATAGSATFDNFQLVAL
jgi:hypothetical protein